MNKYVKRYFEEDKDDADRGHFHQVIAINERSDFVAVCEVCKKLPRGWFELSCLDRDSRLEFVERFWRSKLGDHSLISDFFKRLEDIVIYLIQPQGSDEFLPVMVYSLKDDEGFFQGTPPFEEIIIENNSFFGQEPLPSDYIAFQHVHASFRKNADIGIFTIKELKERWKIFQVFLEQREPILLYSGEEVDRKKLIPFYNSYGRYSWQCFYAEWYPEDEMGNVEISHETVFLPLLNVGPPDGFSFASFLDWLAFYLQGVQEV